MAALSEASLVLPTVAAAIGTRDSPNSGLAKIINAQLLGQPGLLILDNCEHVIAACAQLCQALLTACPLLRILATSREILGVPGEVVWPVPPLSIPDPGPGSRSLRGPPTPLQSEAVLLFAQRAAATLPNFDLTPQNATIIADICRRLDGLPLAIELAAALMRILSLEQIAQQLEAHNSLQLLTAGKRTWPERHQTLKAALDWSYNLLPAHEQRIFRQLAVFPAGCSLEGVEALCAPGLPAGEVLPALLHLADKSLLEVHRQGAETRYRMLDTVRQYAYDQLTQAEEGVPAHDRQLAYYAELTERAEPHLSGANQVDWFERLELELGNLRMALEWAVSPSDANAAFSVTAGLRLSAALLVFWDSRGHSTEGAAWLQRLLDLPEAQQPAAWPARAKALGVAALLRWSLQDSAEARVLVEQALALGRQLGDPIVVAQSLRTMGSVATSQRDYAAARRWLADSVALWRSQPGASQYGLPWALMSLAGAELMAKEYDTARQHLVESISLFRAVGNLNFLAYGLRRLGQVELRQGRHQEASQMFQESLQLNRVVGSQRGVAACLLALGGAGLHNQAGQLAARLLGAAEALLERTGETLAPIDQADLESHSQAAWAMLGDDAFQAAWNAGRAWPTERAIEAARTIVTDAGRSEQRATSREPAEQYGGLTTREREVARLVAQGHSNRQIAQTLVVGVKTVEAHVSHILSKLGFSSRAQIAAWAVQNGLAAAPTAED